MKSAHQNHFERGMTLITLKIAAPLPFEQLNFKSAFLSSIIDKTILAIKQSIILAAAI